MYRQATERVLLLQLRSFRLYVNKGKVLFQFVEINCRMYPRVQRPHERAQEFFPPAAEHCARIDPKL